MNEELRQLVISMFDNAVEWEDVPSPLRKELEICGEEHDLRGMDVYLLVRIYQLGEAR